MEQKAAARTGATTAALQAATRRWRHDLGAYHHYFVRYGFLGGCSPTTTSVRARHRRLLRPHRRCTAAAPIGAAEAKGAAPPFRGDNIDASSASSPYMPAEVIMAKRPPAELQLPGPEPQEQVDDYAECRRLWWRSGAASPISSSRSRWRCFQRRWRPTTGGFPAVAQEASPRRRRPGPSRRHDRIVVSRWFDVFLFVDAALGSYTSTALQIPPPLRVVREEDSDDDLPEGFDMRPERPGGARFNAAIFVPDVDWPDWRVESRGAWSVEVLPDDLELLALPDFDCLAAALRRRPFGAILPGGKRLLHSALAPRPARRTHPEEACRPARRRLVRCQVYQDT